MDLLESFATNALRVERRKETEELVTQALGYRSRDHWIKLFDEAGIPCGAVHTLGEMSTHPHSQASGMILDYEHHHFGALKGVAQPLRFDGHRTKQRLVPPLCGEHSMDILREMGLTESDIDKLISKGLVTQAATA